ncbi:MAG: ABC transporter substrate-binding protein [Salinispira sp.]
MKALSVFLMCVSLSMTLWAGGAGESGAEEVTIMTSAAKFKESYREIIDKMEREEGLKVDLQVIPDDQYQNLVQIRLAGNEVPDIIVNNAPEQYFAMRVEDTMRDLSDQPWVSRMVHPSLVRDANGRVWAMPQESGSFFGACYYNKDVLARLGFDNPSPETFDEFIELLKNITAADPDVVPLFMNHRDSWTTQVFTTAGYSIALADRGPEVYGNIMTNKTKFSDVPEFKTVLRQFKRLIDEGLVNADHLSAGYDDGLAAVASGRAAMIYNGEWTVSGLEAEGADIGSFIIPWADNDIMSTGAFVQGFFVPRNAPNTEGALKFLELYSSPEYMDIFFAENPGFPAFTGVDPGNVNVNLSAMVDSYLSRNATVNQMNDYMSPLASIWGELWGSYVEYAAGQMSVDEVLKFWDDVVSSHLTAIGHPGW